MPATNPATIIFIVIADLLGPANTASSVTPRWQLPGSSLIAGGERRHA